MEDRRKTYQLFVIVIMLVLLTGGVILGLSVSNEDEIANINETQYVSNENVEVIMQQEDEIIEDVELVYVDIYSECNHASENRSNEYGVDKEVVKKRELEKIQNENSKYVLVQDNGGILMFQKIHNCKCSNHYLLKFDNDRVVIYRYSEEGEYTKYQDTDILKESIRPDLAARLIIGIEAETTEELYMFLEEIES